MSKDRVLNTDGNHRLWFLNKIISNLNSTFLNVFHGVNKRMMPLYLSEYEWRFNHRHTKDDLSKISAYIQSSSVTTREMNTYALNSYEIQRGLA